MSRLRRRMILFVLVGVTMLLLSTGVALAASTLDQQNTVYTDPNNPSGGFIGAAANQRIGQTFTAGITGDLDKVSLYGALNLLGLPNARPPGDLTVDIFAVDASGSPTGSSLGQGSVPPSTLSTSEVKWFDVPLSEPAPVSSGTQYALVVSSTEDFYCPPPGPNPSDPQPCTGIYYLGVAGSGNPYPGGQLVGNVDADLAFKTYVSPALQEVPTTKEQCKNGGWKRFKDESGQPLFKNQGQCIKYVNKANK